MRPRFHMHDTYTANLVNKDRRTSQEVTFGRESEKGSIREMDEEDQ